MTEPIWVRKDKMKCSRICVVLCDIISESPTAPLEATLLSNKRAALVFISLFTFSRLKINTKAIALEVKSLVVHLITKLSLREPKAAEI